MKINFNEITPEDFEFLCEDLLTMKGLAITSRPSRGPDLGKDIIAKRITKDDMNFSEEEVFLVECKHYSKSGKSVRPTDLGNIYTKMKMHSANRYLLITSSTVSEMVKNQLKTISEDPSNPLKATSCVKNDLIELLNNYPILIKKYFSNWDKEAQIAAKYCNEHLYEAHHGAILWSKNITAIFGNDGYSPKQRNKSKNIDLRPQKEVEALRERLSLMKIEELAFAVFQQDTWVLLANTNKVIELNDFIWTTYPSDEDYLSIQKMAAFKVLWHFFDRPLK